MNNIIPSQYFYDIYINLCLVLVLFTLFHALVLKVDDKKNIHFINVVGYCLLIFIIIFIGQREITSRYGFGDTINYFKAFSAYKLGAPITEESDLGWHMFMKSLSVLVSGHTFFTICSFLYVFPLYKISKQLFHKYWYYAFFMFIVSFSFWTYGVNGVRNGIAASIFLWGLCYHKNKIVMALFFLWAVTFHKTILLPVIAFAITYFYNNPKVYLKAWMLCIPLSLAMGSVWIALFTSLGFGDDRLSAYLTSEATTKTGFRWDFLFHSMFAVFAGWYYIYRKKFNDNLYNQLLNTYLICNGFWILVINANFSNRFAYLSWFMMGLVIVYPLLKDKIFKNHYLMMSKILIAYFSFTYLMAFVYYGH